VSSSFFLVCLANVAYVACFVVVGSDGLGVVPGSLIMCPETILMTL
jgi:hypothetical protein